MMGNGTATEVATTAPTMVPAAIAEQAKAIEQVIQECQLVNVMEMGRVNQMFQMARGVQKLRKLITPEMMEDIKALQNTALGFRTDKPEGYGVDVIRDVTIEALLRGGHMVGNETNIIGGRWYGTKEFYQRKLREFSGLSELRLKMSPPKQAGPGGAIVTCSATWKLGGHSDAFAEREIPIRVNQGMTADAVLGKATRKLLAAIYAQLTGSEQPEGEVDDATAAERATNITHSAAGDGNDSGGGSRADALHQELSPAVKPNDDTQFDNDSREDPPKAVAKPPTGDMFS